MTIAIGTQPEGYSVVRVPVFSINKFPFHLSIVVYNLSVLLHCTVGKRVEFSCECVWRGQESVVFIPPSLLTLSVQKHYILLALLCVKKSCSIMAQFQICVLVKGEGTRFLYVK